ncbi:hypothetical protein QBC43DRAFT_324960 [Cladorrhinum sp. PSN259]|nr:hypothetical protein QBC43DRAFT_324960 [Cladorrhinum sp. PSN259]
MECTDKSCSYGCMEMHRSLSDSKYYYCHNRNCVNHTGTVHVSLDEKGGWIHSTRPKQRRPEPSKPGYYRDPRPGVPRPGRRKSTDSYGRPPSPEPARPRAPRPARRKSTTTYGPPPPEPPRFTRQRSRTRGEEAAARTRGEEAARMSRSRSPEGSERRRYEFVDPMDDLTGMFGTSWRPAAPGPPRGGPSYRPAGFYPGNFSDHPPRYS